MEKGKATKTIYPDTTGLYLALSTEHHKKLKIEAAKQGKTMKEIIENLINKL